MRFTSRAAGPGFIDLSFLAVFGAARCAGCGLRVGPLCNRCRATIPPVTLRPPPAPASRLICPWPYEGPVKSLVITLKARGVRTASLPLVDVMAGSVRRAGLAGSVITWVPGRRPEERRRGFDHAQLLALGLGSRIGLPVVPLLARTGRDRDQVGLSKDQRRENLEGAFRPLRAVAAVAPEGVVLVDDVITTGATASACARALIEGGAPFVELVIACSAELSSNPGRSACPDG